MPSLWSPLWHSGAAVILVSSLSPQAQHLTVPAKSLPCSVKATHLVIPFGKVEKEAGTQILLTSGSLLCPICALHYHLTVNLQVPDSAPLFAYAAADEGWMLLTKLSFLSHCKEARDPLQLLQVSGHSFCIGSTTVRPESVAAQGHWKSLVFLLYWHCLKDLLPLMISKSYDRSCIASLKADSDGFFPEHCLWVGAVVSALAKTWLL
ncbi:hypothetical protein OE88DRAFT_1644320 [Heliocybe sulcata]|uniref:Uncharacterized protein n=1 Tax=Heliocybe sulcata TaxID=5364 RepID=A0A5C3N579_9AGAM|nr:hypothetical protein OE88DRAFT_1644320 [Heliocybe sulcata]